MTEIETIADAPAYVAFEGCGRIAAGSLAEAAAAARRVLARTGGAPVLVFDARSGEVVDLDLRGSEVEVAERYADAAQDRVRGRGRPKLGVVSREVTLLPRHWDWLATQPGGASAALRRLVEQARRAQAGADARRAARDAAYRFMSAMAGDLPGFEAASRALFADDLEGLRAGMAAWPGDVGDQVLGRLARVEV